MATGIGAAILWQQQVCIPFFPISEVVLTPRCVKPGCTRQRRGSGALSWPARFARSVVCFRACFLRRQAVYPQVVPSEGARVRAEARESGFWMFGAFFAASDGPTCGALWGARARAEARGSVKLVAVYVFETDAAFEAVVARGAPCHASVFCNHWT